MQTKIYLDQKIQLFLNENFDLGELRLGARKFWAQTFATNGIEVKLPSTDTSFIVPNKQPTNLNVSWT